METLIFFVLSSFRARGKSRNVSVLVAFTLHVGPHASDKNCNPYLIIALWLWLWRGWLKTQGLFIGGHREASTALRAATSQWLPEETSARSLVIFSSSSFVGYFSRLRVSSKRFSWFYETQSQSHPPKSSYLVTLVIPKSQTKNFLRLLGPSFLESECVHPRTGRAAQARSTKSERDTFPRSFQISQIHYKYRINSQNI